MSTFKAEDAPPEKLTVALREAADEVPAEIAQRLQDARRQAALAADEPPGRRLQRPGLAIAASVAAVACALAVGLNLTAPGSAEVPLLPAGSELEFAAAQDLELLEELEFIAWLEEADRGAG